MINFDLTSFKDSNGFVRLCAIPNFDKFIKLFSRISPNNTCNPHDELYKDYNSKTYSTEWGEYNFAALCPAEMFIRRISKFLPCGWVMWSKKINYEPNRINSIINIFGYSYINSKRANSQSIKILYVDGYGKYDTMVVNIDDLHNIVYKPLTEEDITIYKEYIKLTSQKASPIYEIMIIKQSYKDNYNIYLDDCKKYGFTPLDKVLIERINIEYNGIPTTLTKEGVLGGQPNEDTIIVNF